MPPLIIMAKIKIGNTEHELSFNLQALNEINKKFGSLEKLQEELTDNENQLDTLKTFIWLITLMANQAILERNLDIEMGLAQGEKSPLLSEDYFFVKLHPRDLFSQKDAIYEAIAEGVKFEPIEEDEENVDLDLKEIEAEKNA